MNEQGNAALGMAHSRGRPPHDSVEVTVNNVADFGNKIQWAVATGLTTIDGLPAVVRYISIGGNADVR